MSELALAVYASETGTHLVRPPAGARYAAHVRGFDGGAYERRLADAGLGFVGRGAALFPALLRSIHDPPPGLFVRGAADVELLSRPAVAVVGARACSGYGAQVARTLARDLAAAGVIVVCGLARGIDAEAHRGALDAGGRRSRCSAAASTATTRRRTPNSHAGSPRPAGSSPSTSPASSPRRGVSRPATGSSPRCADAVVIVEARSRAAHSSPSTSRWRSDAIYAVPGEITSVAPEGTNDLLKLGASPLTSAADVLSCFGIEAKPDVAHVEGTAAKLLEQLRESPAGADELVRGTGFDAGEVARALVELELAGLAVAADGVYRAAGI